MTANRVNWSEDQIEFLQSIDPDNDALIECIRPCVTDVMLRRIAESDYGYDAERYYRGIEQIRDTGQWSGKQVYELSEVLNLVGYDNPGEQSWDSECVSVPLRDRHVTRAFCCACLLAGASDPHYEGYYSGRNQMIAGLIESAFYLHMDTPSMRQHEHRMRRDRTYRLGATVVHETMRTLAAFCRLIAEWEDESWAFWVGILLCGVHRGTFDAAQAEQLCWWIKERAIQHIREGGIDLCQSDKRPFSYESQAAASCYTTSSSPLNTTIFSNRHQAWRGLVPRAMQDAMKTWRSDGNTNEADRVGAFVSWFVS